MVRGNSPYDSVHLTRSGLGDVHRAEKREKTRGEDKAAPLCSSRLREDSENLAKARGVHQLDVESHPCNQSVLSVGSEDLAAHVHSDLRPHCYHELCKVAHDDGAKPSLQCPVSPSPAFSR